MVIPVFALRTSGSSPHGMLKTASGVQPSQPRRLSQHNGDCVDWSVSSQPKASSPSRVDRHFQLPQIIQFCSRGYGAWFLLASCVILWYGKTWSHGQVQSSGCIQATTVWPSTSLSMEPVSQNSAPIRLPAVLCSGMQKPGPMHRWVAVSSGCTQATTVWPTTSSLSLELVSQNSAPVRLAVWCTEHLLQACLLPHNCRSDFCLVETAVVRKVFSSWDNLQCMAAFVQKIKVSIWVTQTKKRNCTMGLISTWKMSHMCNNKDLSHQW